ncbi:hypothetical protein GR212_35830 [Rhizobium lusitanum]|uniref:Uncharacterized protein n=1 Tax=Rhizobium lusitanum TaxID=293958 RepID=A0A6L9UL80_9HYPH|nr:hypothetical protein [Rhizobium lusitanum]
MTIELPCLAKQEHDLNDEFRHLRSDNYQWVEADSPILHVAVFSKDNDIVRLGGSAA